MSIMWINSIGCPLNECDYPNSLEGLADYRKDCIEAILLIGSSEEVERVKAVNDVWQGTLCVPRKLWEKERETLLNMDIDVENICFLEEDLPAQLPNMKLSIIAVSEEPIKYIYHLEDEYMTRIYIDCLVESFDVVITNPLLRQSLKTGIDVLYINVEVYLAGSVNSYGHGEYLLRALLYLLNPKYAFSLSEIDIPDNLRHLYAVQEF